MEFKKIEKAVKIVLEYIERWNKQDGDKAVAEAANDIEIFFEEQKEIKQKQIKSAKKTNKNYDSKKRKLAWEKRRNST